MPSCTTTSTPCTASSTARPPPSLIRSRRFRTLDTHPRADRRAGFGSGTDGELAMHMAGKIGAERTAEVMARNDAVFRAANEQIDAFVKSMDGAADDQLP